MRDYPTLHLDTQCCYCCFTFHSENSCRYFKRSM